MKKIFFCLIVLFFSMGLTQVHASDVLFEYRRQDIISRGVTYEIVRQMTQNGMLDIHLLYVDLTDPYLSIEPVANWQEMGRRATTSTLLDRAGAIAGINADYFDMTGNFTNHFGSMVLDGEVIALNTYTNSNDFRYSTFFMDYFNNVFFAYMKTWIRTTINGRDMVNTGITLFNNIGRELNHLTLIDKNGFYSTHEISRRFPGLAFVVVDNGIVSDISFYDVYTPDNGYVLIFPQNTSNNISQFEIGDAVNFEFINSMTLDFSHIRSAIGGGALLLSYGELVRDAASPPAGRQPRAAVGVNQDGSTLIFMVVDGRTHSIGASHADTANLMRRFGGFNAMHLDSGGSATMAHTGSGQMKMVNRPSDGSQRQVANALGVFDNSVIGEIASINIEASSAIVGLPVKFNVYGQDEFLNRIDIPQDEVFFAHEGEFIPLVQGTHTVAAIYRGFTASLSFDVQPIGELSIIPSSISALPGASVNLFFGGIAAGGFSVNDLIVKDITVTPSQLGIIENGVFTAVSSGTGFLTARVGNVVAHIPVSIGGMPWPIVLNDDISFLSYPVNITGSVSYDEFEAGNVYRLNYRFFETDVTQAAHLAFSVPLPGNPVGIRMLVYGNNSGHWLRARVRDANDNTHNINFVNRIDFLGWTEVTAILPTDVPGPFTLERIYAATLNHNETMDYNLSFTHLAALFAPNEHTGDIPTNTVFSDFLRVTPDFIGTQNIDIPIPTTRQEYSTNIIGNTIIINISAIGGGISAVDRNQWGRITQDLNTFLAQNVIIIFDENPKTAFESRYEYELFHLAMSQQRELGRTVFVVSATGDSTGFDMRDEIRYINLGVNSPNIRFWLEYDRILWTDM